MAFTNESLVNDAIQLPGFFWCVQRCKFSSTMLSIFLVDQNTYITATTYIYGQRVFYWAYFNAYSSKTICLSLRFIICWFFSWFQDKSYQIKYSYIVHEYFSILRTVTQILREINFGEFRSFKIAVFVILGAQNFVVLLNFSLQKVQKFIKIQI